MRAVLHRGADRGDRLPWFADSCFVQSQFVIKTLVDCGQEVSVPYLLPARIAFGVLQESWDLARCNSQSPTTSRGMACSANKSASAFASDESPPRHRTEHRLSRRPPGWRP